jgi:hypothetical protein
MNVFCNIIVSVIVLTLITDITLTGYYTYKVISNNKFNKDKFNKEDICNLINKKNNNNETFKTNEIFENSILTYSNDTNNTIYYPINYLKTLYFRKYNIDRYKKMYDTILIELFNCEYNITHIM